MQDWIIVLNLDENIESLVKSLIKNNANKKQGLSTTGKNAKQFYIDEKLANKEFDFFLDKLNNILIDQKLLRDKRKIEIVHCWTVLGYENSFHKIHRHTPDPECRDISLVYYISVPEYDEHKPGTFYAILNTDNGSVYEYIPKKNDLIIFPCTVLHGTYPQGKGLRQTLNMDVRIFSDVYPSRQIPII